MKIFENYKQGRSHGAEGLPNTAPGEVAIAANKCLKSLPRS
jgi:hypothetical protein